LGSILLKDMRDQSYLCPINRALCPIS
jgi:hypothetical protein